MKLSALLPHVDDFFSGEEIAALARGLIAGGGNPSQDDVDGFARWAVEKHLEIALIQGVIKGKLSVIRASQADEGFMFIAEDGSRLTVR